MQGPTRSCWGRFLVSGSVRGDIGASWSVKSQPGVYRNPIMAREGLGVEWDQQDVAREVL